MKVKWLNNGLVIHLKRPGGPCKVNLSGGCVRISEKTHVFATALRTSFIRYKKNERTEKELLSTAL